MKKVLVLVILILISRFVSSQEYYDLIVLTNGDSIACIIDSVNETHVFFNMNFKKKWVHTKKNKNEIIKYERNALDRELIRFKSRTSNFIIINKVESIKNNFNLVIGGNGSFISVQYERIFFISPRISQTIGIGFGHCEEIIFNLWGSASRKAEKFTTIPFHITSNLLFKKKHFLLFGLGSTLMNGESNQYLYIYPILGYRMRPSKSFNFGPFIAYPLNQKVLDRIIFIPFGFSLGLCF